MTYLRAHVFTVIVPLLVLLVALTAGTWIGGRVDADSRASLASALDALPASAQVASVTDWAQIRDGVGIDDAALRDVSTRSVLASSAEQMQSEFGWSVADLDWEALGQTAAAESVLVAQFSSSALLREVEESLNRLGYQRRDSVWTLDDDGRAKIGPRLAGVLGSVAIVARQRLVVAGSSVGDVRRALAPIQHGARSLLDRRPVADLAAALAGAEAVLIQSGSVACVSAALPDDPEVAAQAVAAVARAGELVRPQFTGRALSDVGRRQQIRFAAVFGSRTVAAQQATVRGALATGQFVGRSGRVEDSLRLESATSAGAVSTLRFEVAPDRGAYMSGEGPLLFAGCP